MERERVKNQNNIFKSILCFFFPAERQRRGESPLRGVALVPIDSLRRQYEEERRRREHARMNARNQKYFASIG